MFKIIDILLTTYNGEKYLREQIDSILNQDYKLWKLLIRDDGSSDGTVEIIKEYQQKYPTQIFFEADDNGRLGAAKSFLRLVSKCQSSYMAFCDQDDIWLPNKLKLQIDRMLATEKQSEPDCPILIHSDLSVVNQNKDTIAKSFWEYQHYNPDKMCTLNNLLIQNHVTGCTILANKALIKLASKTPSNIVMHDWWLALIASCTGKIIPMYTPTVLYRQHQDNDTGAKQWGLLYKIKMMQMGRQALRLKIFNTRKQALSLLDMIDLKKEDARLVKIYVSMFKMNWLDKRLTLIKYDFMKYGISRKIAVLLVI